LRQQGIQTRDRSDPLKDTACRHLRQGRLGLTLNQPWVLSKSTCLCLLSTEDNYLSSFRMATPDAMTGWALSPVVRLPAEFRFE